jgi:hypothetical protein
VVGGLGHLAHQVAGQEHGPAFASQSLHGLAHPADAFGVKPVDGLVEDENLRVGHQCVGDPQTLAHPQGEGADRLVRDFLQAGDRQQVVHPAPAKAVGRGLGKQVLEGCACGVERLGVEQAADDLERVAVVGQGPIVEEHVAVVGSVEAQQQPHRSGLARSVRSEEAGDMAGAHRERGVVNG